MKLPQARNKNVIIQETSRELLVYDLLTNKAYNLNQTSAVVFTACDGETTFAELKGKHKYSDDLIYLALDDLKRNGLLAEDYQSKYAGVSRREVIKRVGLATMIALPVITSLIAPTSASAQSGCTNSGNSQDRGSCPSGQRCVNGSCSPCIQDDQPLPGGCPGSINRCCSIGCTPNDSGGPDFCGTSPL